MKHTAKSLLSFGIMLALLVGMGVGVYAQQGQQPGTQQQQDVPDVDPESQEFDQFVDALETVQQVQEEVNQEIDEIISQSDMSEEKFNEVHQQLQGQPDGGGQNADVSDAEREEYGALIEEIGSTQESSQEEMISSIEENGLNVERFNEIMMAVRSDQELQQRLQQEMDG